MTPRTRWAAAAAAALFAGPALADEKDDRIERLERETAELRREIDEMKASRAQGAPPDEKAVREAVDDYLSRAGSSDRYYSGPGGVRRPSGNLVLGGYFSTRYVASEEPDAVPSFSDMRLVPQVHAEITRKIAFDAEVEFEHGGVSDEIDGEIAVEFAELSFRQSDEFTLKVGTLLVPFGAFNQSHDDPLNELSSRPTVARFVVPSAFGSPGVGAMGAFEVTKDDSLTYDVALTNGFKDEFDGDEGSRAARGLYEQDDNHDKTLFGRLAIVPTLSFLDALQAGVSGAYGAVGEQSDRLTGYGFDLSGKTGPWEFKGEYDEFGIDRPSGSPPPVDAAGNLGPVRGLHGWYGQLLYRFTDKWVRCIPFAEKDASLALVLRRDDVDLNDRVHGAGAFDDERAWSFGITYRPTSKTAVKLEYRRASSGAQGDLGQERDLFAVEFATYF
jgi:hypothetical protein